MSKRNAQPSSKGSNTLSFSSSFLSSSSIQVAESKSVKSLLLGLLLRGSFEVNLRIASLQFWTTDSEAMPAELTSPWHMASLMIDESVDCIAFKASVKYTCEDTSSMLSATSSGWVATKPSAMIAAALARTLSNFSKDSRNTSAYI